MGGSHGNTWRQSPRPREQPLQTREGNLIGLRPLWPKQGGQGQPMGDEVREVSGSGQFSTGRTLAFPLSEIAPQEG